MRRHFGKQAGRVQWINTCWLPEEFVLLLPRAGDEIMRLTGKRLLMLLLYAPVEDSPVNVPILGRTRLMKMAFLFKEEVATDFLEDRNADAIDLPEFYPWRYGPFSAKLLDDLEFLVNRGYILRSAAGASPLPEELDEYTYWLEDFDAEAVGEYTQEEFSLTDDRGIPKASELWTDLTSNQQTLVSDFKKTLVNVSLDRILEYVYKKYAERGYTDRSLIRERYLT
jgi:uncharacterized protein YwgA